MPFKIERTISLGHILTALTLVLSVVAAYYSLREEVHTNSLRIEYLEKVLERDVGSIKSDINRIYDTLKK